MKNQNDMIFSIVAVVLALIFGSVFFFTKREPIKPADPEQVPLSKPAFAPGNVVMANSLPGADNTNNAGGGGGGAPGPGLGRGAGPSGGPPSVPSAAGVSGAGGAGGGPPSVPSAAGVSGGPAGRSQ